MSMVILSGCVQPLPTKLASPGRTLSVCQLSRNFGGYAGQIVEVRGIYYGGLQQRCPQVCPGGEWPSVLDLDGSQNSETYGVRVPFVTDERNWDSLFRAVLRAADEAEKVEVWATFRGYLFARVNSRLGPCDLVANGMVGAGLHTWTTHGGVLILEQIRDVEIHRNAITGYDYSIFRGKHIR